MFTDFIEKALKKVCLVIGIVVFGTLVFMSLTGDLGVSVTKIVCIAIGVMALGSWIDTIKDLKKSKTTDLLGDED